MLREIKGAVLRDCEVHIWVCLNATGHSEAALSSSLKAPLLGEVSTVGLWSYICLRCPRGRCRHEGRYLRMPRCTPPPFNSGFLGAGHTGNRVSPEAHPCKIVPPVQGQSGVSRCRASAGDGPNVELGTTVWLGYLRGHPVKLCENEAINNFTSRQPSSAKLDVFLDQLVCRRQWELESCRAVAHTPRPIL